MVTTRNERGNEQHFYDKITMDTKIIENIIRIMEKVKCNDSRNDFINIDEKDKLWE